ncbi:MAG: F0F1 ATP synthase subunit B [Lachnospiraceae bacterium]|nr:F0F1 ATP synthase subunit B [Lachnospiraceae bacterium]
MNVQELVTLVPWTFVAQICNLFIQVYLIRRFLFKPISEVIEKRRQLANAQITEAEAANREAQAMKADYEKNLAEANASASEIIQAAKRQAVLQSEAIVKEAQTQAAALKQKADADIAQEKVKVFNQMKDEIGDIAMDIAAKVIEREISEKDHQKLINDMIENVGDLT